MKKEGVETKSSASTSGPEAESDKSVKIVEVGRIENEEDLFKEISLQLDGFVSTEASPEKGTAHLESKIGPSAKKVDRDQAKKTVRSAEEKRALQAPAGARTSGPIARNGVAMPKAEATEADGKRGSERAAPKNIAKGSDLEKAPAAAPRPPRTPLQDLEEARARSARAARLMRREKRRRWILVVLSAGVVLTASSAGYWLLSREKSAPIPPEPAKFTVPRTPPVHFEAPEPAKKIVHSEEQATAASQTQAPGSGSAADQETPDEIAAGKRTEAELQDFLLGFASAWEKSAGRNGDISAFASCFSPEFSPTGADRKAWIEEKAVRNRKKEWIRIRISGTKTDLRPNGTAALSFVQTYESSNYSDQTDQTMILRKENGAWKILAVGP